MINLASKRENEEAFCTGLVNGFGPPGFSMNYFYDVDREWEEPWYHDELSLTGTTVPGENTDLQFSYNLGYATSVVGFSTAFYGLGVAVSAQSGFLTTVGMTGLDLAAHLCRYLHGTLRAGARSLPLVGLLFFMLYGGTQIGHGIREQQRRDAITDRPHGGY